MYSPSEFSALHSATCEEESLYGEQQYIVDYAPNGHQEEVPTNLIVMLEPEQLELTTRAVANLAYCRYTRTIRHPQ